MALHGRHSLDMLQRVMHVISRHQLAQNLRKFFFKKSFCFLRLFASVCDSREHTRIVDYACLVDGQQARMTLQR